jgi:hypothetical protein
MSGATSVRHAAARKDMGDLTAAVDFSAKLAAVALRCDRNQEGLLLRLSNANAGAFAATVLRCHFEIRRL